MAQLIKSIFWNPAIYSVSTAEGTKFSLHRGVIAARALIAGGAVFALASRALPERYSRLFPYAAAGVAALAMSLLAAAGGKKEIQTQILNNFLKNPYNPPADVKTYLESKEFETFMGDREAVWQKLCNCSGNLKTNALFQRVVLTVYNAFSQSDKDKAFEQSALAINWNVFHALLDSTAELHMPIPPISLSLEAALLLKQRGIDVKPAARLAKNGNAYAYCFNEDFPTLHVDCVNILLDLPTEQFQKIYPRLLDLEKFWDQPNDGLFDLENGAAVQSLWNSALQRCSRPKNEKSNEKSLLCDVLRKRWIKPLPWEDLIGEENFSKRLYIKRSMICILVQHKILTPDQISDNDLFVLWTDPFFINEETAALLKEHQFSPNVRNKKNLSPLRSVLFAEYNNDTWSKELHVKALLDAGATYSTKVRNQFSEADKQLGELFDQYHGQLLDWSTPQDVQSSAEKVSPGHFYKVIVSLDSWECFTKFFEAALRREDVSKDRIAFYDYFVDLMQRTKGEISIPFCVNAIGPADGKRLLKIDEFLERADPYLFESVYGTNRNKDEGFDVLEKLKGKDQATDAFKHCFYDIIDRCETREDWSRMSNDILQWAFKVKCFEDDRGRQIAQYLISKANEFNDLISFKDVVEQINVRNRELDAADLDYLRNQHEQADRRLSEQLFY